MSTPLQDRKDVPARVTTHVPGHVDHTDGGVDVLDGLGHDDAHHFRDDILGTVWRFFINMRTGLWLILVLGVLSFVGSIVDQATPEQLADPAAYDAWYEAVPKREMGGWASVFDALGLLHVFSTWYFRALFVFLALSILACSVNRTPRLWRVATRPRTSMSDVFFSHAPLRSTFDLRGDEATVADRVRAAMRHDHYRVLDGTAKTGRDVYADRFRWGPFGTVLAHLSFVVIMAGFVVSATTGFKDEGFIAPVGVPVEVGHGTGLSVTAKSFTDTYYDNGQPKDYVSDLVLTKDGRQVARQKTRVNTPLIHDGVWFHQASFGVGADLDVVAKGQRVHSGTVPLQYSSSDASKSIGRLDLPAKGLTIYLVEAASGRPDPNLPAGTLQLEIHTAAAPDAEPTVEVIPQGKPTTIDGVTYTFERNRQYTGLTVKRDNGSWLVWAGSALLIAGCYLVFFLPHRRIWARVRDNGDGTSRVMIGAPLKRDPAFEPRFQALVTAIQSSDASSAPPRS